jgi:hypothetical protein
VSTPGLDEPVERLAQNTATGLLGEYARQLPKSFALALPFDLAHIEPILV